MNNSFLVEGPNGSFVRKTRAELLPEDHIVFDGPDAFRSVQDAEARLDAEITAAGGIDAWRAGAPSSS
ncbi:hypothetical protein [Piscinibacter sp.]|uniref:hypothetical protein n=1 Tax=Piscinibacter sp. TaxID=1903157 RepID=UPI002C9D44FA|nr:hypothetical protein [Albitalea sp.]HUG26412.1 hypothetical protein [Albitalea sp.]